MKLLELSSVSKVYESGDTETIALNDISFQLNQGEFLSIMGPSGSGKSTLLHILGLLDRPTSGEYFFQGKNIDSFSDDELAAIRNQKIGFIFQRFNLLQRSTVFDNVLLPLYYSGLPKNQWKKLVTEAVDLVGLGHRLHHLSNQLSGGESQRVAIARAIVNNPDLIFADEPTGNLDTKTGEQIMKIISSLNDQGNTVILITHETSAAGFGGRIITLKDGEIQSDKKQRKKKQFSK